MSNDEQEDRLLAELRRLTSELDPVPDEVTAYAKAALGWRRIDAELAELLSDSALEQQGALTRSGVAQARSMSFRASELELDVEIRDVERGVVVMGQLAPPTPARVAVQRDDGSEAASVEADELGRFRFELQEGGRIRLRILRKAPAKPIETSWLDV